MNMLFHEKYICKRCDLAKTQAVILKMINAAARMKNVFLIRCTTYFKKGFFNYAVKDASKAIEIDDKYIFGYIRKVEAL